MLVFPIDPVLEVPYACKRKTIMGALASGLLNLRSNSSVTKHWNCAGTSPLVQLLTLVLVFSQFLFLNSDNFFVKNCLNDTTLERSREILILLMNSISVK